MQKVIIYTTAFCPYCMMAKRLLSSKSVEFEEIPVDGKPAEREALRVKAGGATTVPQIWIGEHHVGGCDELYTLERAGELDPMLQA